MPRLRSPHRPNFSEEDLAKARSCARRHNAAHTLVRRAQLALLIHPEPDLTHEESGGRIGLDKEPVYKWRRRWTIHGFSLVDALRSERPRSFPPLDA